MTDYCVNGVDNNAERKWSELQTIFDIMSDVVYVVGKDGRYMLLNKAAKEFVQDFTISNIEDFYTFAVYYDMDGCMIPLENSPVKKVLRGEQVRAERMKIAYGDTVRYISVNGTPLYNGNMSIEYAVISNSKITCPDEKENIIKEQLAVYCLGGLEIRCRDGSLLRLNSSKSTELLVYLLLNKGKPVSKWSIMEDVFRGMPPKNAEVYLNTTVYKLRKALAPSGMKTAVISADESYWIDLKKFSVDFLDFEKQVGILSSINEFNLENALKTEKLYAGDLFGDKSYNWSLLEKERLLELYWNFAKELAVYLLERNNLTMSLRILKKLSKKNELDEDINCLLMKIYTEKRDKVSLIRQYERHIYMLQKELKVPPSSMTTVLYIALRKTFIS